MEVFGNHVQLDLQAVLAVFWILPNSFIKAIETQRAQVVKGQPKDSSAHIFISIVIPISIYIYIYLSAYISV